MKSPKWLATITSGLVVISMAAVGMSSAAQAAVPTHHAAKHASATRCPKRNKATGIIKWSDWQFPDTLNEYQTNASVSGEVIDSLYSSPVWFNSQGKVFPMMLKSLPKLTGKTATATLKSGMHWNNGKEITAADVKFGWQVSNYAPAGGTPWCSGTCDVISRIDTVGKYGLVFHLKHVYAPFTTNALFNITPWPTSWSGSAGGWSKGDYKGAYQKLFLDQSYNFEGPGYPEDGPYQVSQFVQNDRIVLVPNNHYDVMSCGAKIKTLIFVFYSSKPAMIAAAASHQTDSSTDYSLADIPTLLQHASAFHVHNDPGYLIEHLTFMVDPTYNGATNPLHNLKVRQALALALDKYGLIQSALGLSRSAANQIIAWTFLIDTPKLVQPFADKSLKGQWDPIAKKYQTNTGTGQALADAKKLLTQAGYPGGKFTLDGVTTQGNPVRVAQFNVILKSWSNVGVTFNPTYIPAGTLFSDWDHGSPLHTGKFQVAMFADVGYPDPDGFRTTMDSHYIDRLHTTHSTVNANNAGIQDSVIDHAYSAGAASYDPKVRQKWYNVIQVEMNKQAYWVDLFYRGSINTDDGKIANYSSNPTNEGEEWNTYAWAPKGSS